MYISIFPSAPHYPRSWRHVMLKSRIKKRRNFRRNQLFNSRNLSILNCRQIATSLKKFPEPKVWATFALVVTTPGKVLNFVFTINPQSCVAILCDNIENQVTLIPLSSSCESLLLHDVIEVLNIVQMAFFTLTIHLVTFITNNSNSRLIFLY